jgi:hypothetical protein
MRRKREIADPQAVEDKQLNAFLDEFSPRQPMIRIYRVEADGKKHTYLGASDLDCFSLEGVREHFGGGTFLLRSVRSNGTYGPSRVVSIAPLLRDRER